MLYKWEEQNAQCRQVKISNEFKDKIKYILKYLDNFAMISHF